MYTGSWTASANDVYTAVCIVYTDAGYTTESTVYGRSGFTAKVDELETNVDDIETDTNELQTDWIDGGRLDLLLDFIKDVSGGRWIRDGSQMKFYKDDNITLVATFDLKKSDGTAAGENDNAFERVRA
jgi:hypothetical protein